MPLILPSRRKTRYPSRERRDHADTMRVTVFVAIATLFAGLFALLAPGAGADKHKKDKSGEATVSLDKKFKGRLPITELTEDDAIFHALNRLAYGPRPGDVERVRQLGLEKWVDQQLDPDSIDDSALNVRLEKYPTLRMSSRQLLERFPAQSGRQGAGFDERRFSGADAGKAA